MKIETSKLQGAALDWAVLVSTKDEIGAIAKMWAMVGVLARPADILGGFHPSTDWSQGGPLVESRMVKLTPWQEDAGIVDHWEAIAQAQDGDVSRTRGESPLQAAMRAIVLAELGDTVDIPEELAA